MKHLFREGAEPIDTWIEVDGGGLGPSRQQSPGLLPVSCDVQGTREATRGGRSAWPTRPTPCLKCRSQFPGRGGYA